MFRKPMYIAQFLTDYDDALTGELNIDPLGQLVIWSSWGQDIFHSRITSIANDVRQYTLNLLHHSVMRQLLADEHQQISGAMKSRYHKKQLPEFRAACLIHLENIYIYSMLAAEKNGVTLTGVLGINKARIKWNELDNNPQIRFGLGKKSELLTNQLALGTNGRYKSPMMKMNFFSTDYRYDVPGSKPEWQAAEAFIQRVPELATLRAEALRYLQRLMEAPQADALTPEFKDIPVELRDAYSNAFPDRRTVGKYSRHFWLQRTGLDKNAAGAIYRVLEKEDQHSDKWLPAARVFEYAEQQAKMMPEMDKGALTTIQHIRLAEPFLSLIELMFSGLRRQSSQTLADFHQFWQERGLTEQSLPQLAAKIRQNSALISSLSGTPARRFEQLLTLACEPSLDGQVRGLLAYHNELMEARGQFPWLELSGEDLILQVPPSSLRADRQNDDWVNHYYLPQFRHLLNGLWGNIA